MLLRTLLVPCDRYLHCTTEKIESMRYLVIIACIALISACQSTGDQNASGTVALTGQIDNPTGDEITLRKVAWIGDDLEISRDSLNGGQFDLSTEINEPGVYRLRAGRDQALLFLHPGDALEIKADGQDFAGTLLFEGTGDKANNYLAEKERRRETYNSQYEESNVYKEDLEPFLTRHNGYREMQNELYDKRFGQGAPSEEFETFARAEIIASWASVMSNYPDYHGYYAELDSFEVDEDYHKYKSEILLTLTDELNSPAYRGYINAYVARKLSDMVSGDESLQDDWPAAYREHFRRIKVDENLGEDVRDYVLAAQLNDYISYFGVDGVDPIYDEYQTINKNPQLLEPIKANYDAWSLLAIGKKAPDFKYKSIDGDEMSLADFKGRVVYVDVWATWCGPCKREIPASKDLKKKFAGQDEVAFMYVSVDDDQEAWEKYLADDPEFKGVHLITGTGWKSDITEDYMIKGIPRYMLIDQSGNIANASAPRPSSGEKIEGMIRELLAQSGPSGD